MKTVVIVDPRFTEYVSHRQHIESPSRIAQTISLMQYTGLNKRENIAFHSSIMPKKSEIEQVHSDSYLDFLMKLSDEGCGKLDDETFVSKKTYTSALLSAGGAIKASDLVATRSADNAFAIIRPPGHHSGRTMGGGFCYLNNVAIAVKHARRLYGYDNILILDWDNHYGNGTVDIFRGDKKILYVSVDEDMFTEDKRGFVDVEDNIVHMALPYEVGKSYVNCWSSILSILEKKFSPDFIFCSAGQDSHFSDPLSNLNIVSSQYGELVRISKDMAKRLCGDRLVLVLEGGYNPEMLAICNCTMIDALANSKRSIKIGEIEPYYWWYKFQPEPSHVTRRMEELIKESKHKLRHNLLK